MKKLSFAALLLLCLPFSVSGQTIKTTAGRIQRVLVAPSGSCTSGSNEVQLLAPNGTIYTCQSGTWGAVAGGGGASVNPTSGTLPFNNGGTFADSLMSQSGGTVTVAGNLTTTGTITASRTTTSASAELTATKIYNNSVVEAGIPVLAALNMTIGSTANYLSAQPLRYVYTRTAGATGLPSAGFDAFINMTPVVDSAFGASLLGINFDGNIGAGTIQEYTRIKIRSSSNVTNNYSVVVDPGGGNAGFGVSNPDAQLDVLSDSTIKSAGEFSMPASALVPALDVVLGATPGASAHGLRIRNSGLTDLLVGTNDGRLLLGNPTTTTGAGLIVRQPDDTGAGGLWVYANNQTANLKLGWSTLTASAGLLISTGSGNVRLEPASGHVTIGSTDTGLTRASAGKLRVSNGSTGTGDLEAGMITPLGRLMLPMGEVSYFNTTGTTITISGTSDGSTNMVVVNPTTTLNNDMNFDNGGGNTGRLRYTGTTTRTFHVAVTVSGTPATANDIFVLGCAKNGTVIGASKVLGSASGTQFSALHIMVSLATNDYLELFIGNTTAARSFTVKSLNIFAMGM